MFHSEYTSSFISFAAPLYRTNRCAVMATRSWHLRNSTFPNLQRSDMRPEQSSTNQIATGYFFLAQHVAKCASNLSRFQFVWISVLSPCREYHEYYRASAFFCSTELAFRCYQIMLQRPPVRLSRTSVLKRLGRPARGRTSSQVTG